MLVRRKDRVEPVRQGMVLEGPVLLNPASVEPGARVHRFPSTAIIVMQQRRRSD